VWRRIRRSPTLSRLRRCDKPNLMTFSFTCLPAFTKNVLGSKFRLQLCPEIPLFSTGREGKSLFRVEILLLNGSSYDMAAAWKGRRPSRPRQQSHHQQSKRRSRKFRDDRKWTLRMKVCFVCDFINILENHSQFGREDLSRRARTVCTHQKLRRRTRHFSNVA
jgi:hypothetical protein